MYFPDEAEANAADPVLSALDEDDRATLVAEQDGRRRSASTSACRASGETVVLRAVTIFAAIFVPEELREAVSDARVARRRCSTPSGRSRGAEPRRA